jgi:hypothetical protein
MEHVEPVSRVKDLGHQPPLRILDAQDARVDEDFEPDFIELTNTENVGLELQDEVDPGEDPMLPASATEDHSATSFDAHHRGHQSYDWWPQYSHMICGPDIDNPSRGVDNNSFFPDLREHALLHDMDCGSPRSH